MLDSYQIADALVRAGFKSITDPTRTKAHGYRHPQMTHPVYVKIKGVKDALQAATKSPLVIHKDDAVRIKTRGNLAGHFTIEAATYHSAGLLEFREKTQGTPSGRALSVHDLASLESKRPAAPPCPNS